MYLTHEDLRTHLRGENITTLTRGDDAIIDAAIDAASKEARGYLVKYDAEAEFALIGDARNGLLLTFVKDIAVYHLMCLGNPGIDFATREKRYNRAIQWLTAIMRGEMTADLPLKSAETAPPGTILYGSNPKRENHF
jgi:phage gp36-like protein